ncbi:hypothetical protein PHET_10964 [Paragonimus heterotremus]|uniref:DUF4200 domain-containing protein n=1 Tax=Paragonimus heterotremus TaxID=100268 RepID=A0A8J4WDV4_9TREM|nr:hypothetical protein PHET_10964 [Paragonimus heterotremus]
MNASNPDKDMFNKILANKEFSMDEYLRVIFDKRLFVKVPEGEDRNLTSSTKLLAKHNLIKKLSEDLLSRKEEFRVKIEHIQQRRQKLEDKECQLKESLIKFERFFKENDDKRLRALKKLSAERGLQRQRQKEIEALNACNSKLLQKRNKLDSSVKCLSTYRRFLEEIVKQSEDFNEITEIISRYDALMTNLNDLKERDNAINQIAEDMHVNLHKYKEIKNDEKLTLTNELAELRRTLELQQVESRNNEVTWEYARNAAVQRIAELSAAKSAIHNMYCITRLYEKYGEMAKPDDVSSQLNVICAFILDLVKLVKDLS